MKNNWLSVLCGGICAFVSSATFALGLGGITSESALNEPLIAEIALINVGDLENSQILVGIGSDSDYELAGVSREFFHNDLEFEVQVEGVGQPRILVRTKAPLQDPYLNFIVQVRWPQGKLLREYTLLLDMPVFSRQEAEPQTARQTQASAPTTARQAVAQQQTNRQSAQPQPATNTRQTVTTRPTSSAASGSDYRVSTGDTLWSLAGDVAGRAGISRHQAMVAIHDQNRDAFINGDINRLRADALLRIPSESQMVQRSEGQAVRDFSSLTQEATATPIQSATENFRRAANDAGASLGGRLALSTANEGGNVGAGTNQDAASSEDLRAAEAALTESVAENAILKEQLDASEIEKQELTDRLANLEEQLELMREQAAIAIDSEELATVQEAVTAEEPAEEEQAAAPVVAPQPEPTLIDKLMAYQSWILGGLGLVVVVALLVVMLVLRKRRAAGADDELYYDEDEYEDEDESQASNADELADDDYDDELDDEDLEDEDLEDDELDEGIDEITKEISESEDTLDDLDEFEDEPLEATSFDDAEEDEDSFDSDEFDDLDEFFSDEASDATNVLFGEDDEGESSEDQDSDADEEDSPADEDDEEEDDDPDGALEFSTAGLNVSEDPEEDSVFEDDEDNSLEFDTDDTIAAKRTESEDTKAGDSDIDLDDKFDFSDPALTEDLAASAADDFEESIEVHSTDMEELLVPSDDDEEDLLGGGLDDLDDEDSEEDDSFVEQFDEEEDALLDDEVEEDEETPAESMLDLDDDLNLDEDMDADLGDLDLDEHLSDGDADEEFLTKLELAEAYIEMGDLQGAKELLAEVEKDGNAEQKAAAKALLENAKG